MEKNILTEKIINALKDFNRPVQLHELSKFLGIKSDSVDYQKLKTDLKELCILKIIEKSARRRYSIQDYDESSIIEGIVRIRDDRAYVETSKNGFNRIYIKKKHLLTAFEGDTVQVKLLQFRKGKKARGEVVKVLSRVEHIIKGIIEFDGNFNFIIPEDEKYYVDFLIPQKNLSGAKNGDRVKAVMKDWDDRMKSPQADVIEIIRRTKEKVSDYDSVLDEFYLPRDFKTESLKEADDAAKPVNKELISNRLDLRTKDIITIDPVDAKDFDDALSLELLPNGNFQLGVHIADVSYYVPEGNVLDNEARWRGNSVYLVDRVIPMLPEILSNNACSLQPNRVRLAFTVFMEFTKAGILKSHSIHESVIKSKRRFNYDEVDEILKTGKGDFADLLISLNELASTLRKKRFDTGGIDFDSFEVKFTLDENKEPLKAQLKRSTPATRLVEECMLAANQVVATHIKLVSRQFKFKGNLPFLYRVHDEPVQSKLYEVMEFFKTLRRDISLKGKNSKEINNFLDKFENQPEKPIVHQILLRAMAKAEYSSENIGHYGLGFKDYTHFTSPIRRFPDLVVHRLIKEYAKGKLKAERIRFLEGELKEIGEHCTDRERVAMEAERASIKLTQTMMARHYIGKEFLGTISGIVNFGAFVLLDELYAEGLLHMRDLTDDYYYYDEKNYRLIGKRNKRILTFGKRIRVKITRVNVENRRIDLALVSNNII
jgi:ribonuclease R